MPLTLGEFPILDDGHLNRHVWLKLAQFVLLSLWYVPFIISLFLLMSVVYCVPVWASTYPTNLNRIIILQKVVRFISKKTFDSHTNPLFKEFQILKFDLFQIGEFLKPFSS